MAGLTFSRKNVLTSMAVRAAPIRRGPGVAGRPVAWWSVRAGTGIPVVVGVVIAAALRQWSDRPVQWWWRTTIALTVVSLVPPFLAATDTATALTLVLLHLIAAALVVPAVARTLRTA